MTANLHPDNKRTIHLRPDQIQHLLQAAHDQFKLWDDEAGRAWESVSDEDRAAREQHAHAKRMMWAEILDALRSHA